MSPNGTLTYDSKTSDFTLTAVVTGGTSGATGTITDIDTGAGTLELESISGTFQDNESLTGSGGGAALVNGTLVGTHLNDALASPLVCDLDDDYINETIYVGNLYGIMYRVSSIGKGQTPSISKLFDFNPTNTSVDTNPIRAKATYAYTETSGDIWVYYGTGRYESQTDKTNLNQQYFFGIQDSLGSTTTYNLSDLVGLDSASVTDVNTGKDIRYISGSNSSADSWYIALDNTTSGFLGSERVIEKPFVIGGVVFFVTFIPDQDICAGNGDTWVYAVNYNTGTAPTTPGF